MMQKLGFIGSGQMATALAGGFVNSGLIAGQQVVFVNPGDTNAESFQSAVPGAIRLKTTKELLDQVDCVWLSVKPQVMEGVVREISGDLENRHLLVSVAAGINIPTLADWSGHNSVVRVMPNSPCLVQSGVCVYACGATVSQKCKEDLVQLLSTVGFCREVPERFMDGVTGIAGSGPAFVMTVVEALADGAVKAGLPRKLAFELTLETLAGSIDLIKVTGEHPAEIRDKVTSPAGTTIFGMSEIEKHGVRAGLSEAVAAAARRSAELGQN